MTTLNSIDLEQAQNKLETFFDKFRPGTIRGTSFDLMPKKKDIPLIKKAAYSPSKDVFEIVFQYEEKVNLKRQDDVVFIESIDGRLVGIQVLQLKQKGVKSISLELICSTLDNAIQAARVGVELPAKEVAKLDIEKRKIDFFKNIVREDLPQLMSN